MFLEGLDGAVAYVPIVGTGTTFGLVDGRELHDVRLVAGRLCWTEGAVEHHRPAHVDLDGRVVAVADRGVTETFTVRSRTREWSSWSDGVGGAAATSVCAPIPAVVAEVHVVPGDVVVEGQVLVVIEAMKMLQSLCARRGGVVAEVLVRAGEQVGSGDVMITFEQHASETTEETA